MNVLYVTTLFICGGLERMVHLLGESMVKDFNSNVFLYSFDGPISTDDQNFLKKTTGIQPFHMQKGPGFCLKTLWNIVKLARQHKIDVIHTHETAPLMYAVFARVILFFMGRFPKLVHTQHSFVHLQKRSFIRYYDRIFQVFATYLTVVSEQVRQGYISLGVSKKRPLIIENGVQFPEKVLSAAEKQALREQLCTETKAADALRAGLQAKWLICVARVHPGKGQDHLIRLWNHLSSEMRLSSLLVLVGPETEAGELARLRALLEPAKNPERVVFVGSSATPMRWLQAADVFVSGSEYEGMPLAPLEACGAGLPLVLSDIQGHQLLKDQAWFFDFHSPRNGAQAVEHCLARFKNADNAKEFEAKLLREAKKVQAQYSIRSMAEKYFALYS